MRTLWYSCAVPPVRLDACSVGTPQVGFMLVGSVVLFVGAVVWQVYQALRFSWRVSYLVGEHRRSQANHHQAGNAASTLSESLAGMRMIKNPISSSPSRVQRARRSATDARVTVAAVPTASATNKPNVGMVASLPNAACVEYK